MTTPEQLKQYVRNVPGYPQPGVIFRDITPLLARKELFREVVDLMSKVWSDRPPDLVAAIEARGFIPGAAIAVKLNAGFVPIRKTGKLPWKTIAEQNTPGNAHTEAPTEMSVILAALMLKTCVTCGAGV